MEQAFKNPCPITQILSLGNYSAEFRFFKRNLGKEERICFFIFYTSRFVHPVNKFMAASTDLLRYPVQKSCPDPSDILPDGT